MLFEVFVGITVISLLWYEAIVNCPWDLCELGVRGVGVYPLTISRGFCLYKLSVMHYDKISWW